MHTHPTQPVEIIAPGLIQQSFTEAAVFGAAAWLWMHSSSHRGMPLQNLNNLLLPAIRHHQFLLASVDGRAVFYMSWANFSAEAEQRYVLQPPSLMHQDDWCSGDRMWMLDWVAPFGHTQAMSQLIRQQLFAHRCARTLYHRGNQRGLRIKNFYGQAVTREEAHVWFEAHPLLSGCSSL